MSQTSDWRSVIRQNVKKSRYVVITFVLIYSCIGFGIDVLRIQSQYPDMSLEHIALMLLQGYEIPWAMLSMFAVAVVSILMTIKCHDRLMLMGTEYHEVKDGPDFSRAEQELYHLVEEMKIAAGLDYMPKIYVIEADYMNAFASGVSEKSCLIAVTRGLMQKLKRQELQAVIAHELSHIRHQDVKLTLMIGVLGNLMLLVIDILFYNVIYGNTRERNNLVFTVIILMRYFLPVISMLLMLFLSRSREYMADSGAVELMRENESLASALKTISSDYEQNSEKISEEYATTKHEELRQASYIFDTSHFDPARTLKNIFSTHPSLEDRLKAIGYRNR